MDDVSRHFCRRGHADSPRSRLTASAQTVPHTWSHMADALSGAALGCRRRGRYLLSRPSAGARTSRSVSLYLPSKYTPFTALCMARSGLKRCLHPKCCCQNSSSRKQPTRVSVVSRAPRMVRDRHVRARPILCCNRLLSRCTGGLLALDALMPSGACSRFAEVTLDGQC